MFVEDKKKKEKKRKIKEREREKYRDTHCEVLAAPGRLFRCKRRGDQPERGRPRRVRICLGTLNGAINSQDHQPTVIVVMTSQLEKSRFHSIAFLLLLWSQSRSPVSSSSPAAETPTSTSNSSSTCAELRTGDKDVREVLQEAGSMYCNRYVQTWACACQSLVSESQQVIRNGVECDGRQWRGRA